MNAQRISSLVLRAVQHVQVPAKLTSLAFRRNTAAEFALRRFSAASSPVPQAPLPSTTPVVEQTEEEFQIELKKVGAFKKAGMMLKRYGAAAVGVYATLYVIPVGGTFLTAQAFDNFGMDPLELLEQYDLKRSVLELLSMDPNTQRLDAWQTSAVFSLLASEITEPFRIMGTLVLAPKVHTWWRLRKQLKDSAA